MCGGYSGIHAAFIGVYFIVDIIYYTGKEILIDN